MAAHEIARQLRLRDLGGIIIVDFIDLHKSQNRQALHEQMVQEMATDKAKHTVLPLSKFGLMQITRQRIRPAAMRSTQDVCPTCNGTGKIEPTVLLDKKIENRISYLAQDRHVKFLRLRVSPYVGAYLRRGLVSLRLRWMMRYGIWISLRCDDGLGIVDVRYCNRRGEEIKD